MLRSACVRLLGALLLDVEPDASTRALVLSLRQSNLAPSDPAARGDAPTRAPPEFPPLPDMAHAMRIWDGRGMRNRLSRS